MPHEEKKKKKANQKSLLRIHSEKKIRNHRNSTPAPSVATEDTMTQPQLQKILITNRVKVHSSGSTYNYLEQLVLLKMLNSIK